MDESENREAPARHSGKVSERKSTKMSRRDFLKIGGAVAAALAANEVAKRIPKALHPETSSTPERETPTSVAVLDFFDLESVKSDFMNEYFPKDFSEQDALGDMGVEDSSTREGLLQAVPKDQDQARLFMLKALEFHYGNHGRDVAEVMSKTASALGAESSVEMTPTTVSIAEAVTLGEVEFDEIGNPTMHQTLSKEAVISLVRKTGANVINMSFEPGRTSFTYTMYDRKLKHPEMGRQMPSKTTVGEHTTYSDYQGNKISEEEYNAINEKAAETEVVLLDPMDRDIDFLDGYAGEQTSQNVLDLVEIAQRFPDKTFIAAGGNPTYLNGLHFPDIREARELITKRGLWPENLIVVGFETTESGHTVPASLGADVYVSSDDLKELGFFGASSYATPVVTEIVRQLKDGGDKDGKRTVLETMTTDKEVWFGSDQVQYKLLDFQAVKDKV